MVKQNSSLSVAAIILAAGSSQRMGQRNKLLEPVAGVAMVRKVALATIASRVCATTVVTGYDASKIEHCLKDLPVQFMHNQHFQQGMASSLCTGIESLNDVDGVVIVLADMPLLKASHLNALIEQFVESGGVDIIAPVYNKRRGNPVLWPSQFFSQIAQLQGDRGARELLSQFSDQVCLLPFSEDAICVDIDTVDALTQMNQTIVTE